MSIFSAAEALYFSQAAYEYLLDGLSVIPLIGKKCPIPWTLYQTSRARAQDINWWNQTGKFQNIGIVCGAVSGNLVVIDLDGSRAVNLFRDKFPGLRETFTVLTGSGGLHVYLKVGSLPANRKISLGDGHNGIEIRGNGQYVVAPPSVHPDTRRLYRIYQKQAILSVFNLSEVSEWLNTLETPQTREIRPIEREKGKPSIRGDGNVVIYDREGHKVLNPKGYAYSALRDECDRVARAQKGDQNEALYRGAQRMGQFISTGLLSSGEVVWRLRGAANWSDSDQSEQEILATIRSGLRSKAAEDTR